MFIHKYLPMSSLSRYILMHPLLIQIYPQYSRALISLQPVMSMLTSKHSIPVVLREWAPTQLASNLSCPVEWATIVMKRHIILL